MFILFHKSGCSKLTTQDAQSILNENTLTFDNMAKKKKKKELYRDFRQRNFKKTLSFQREALTIKVHTTLTPPFLYITVIFLHT